jgi:hypothetical protein
VGFVEIKENLQFVADVMGFDGLDFADDVASGQIRMEDGFVAEEFRHFDFNVEAASANLVAKSESSPRTSSGRMPKTTVLPS